MSRTDTATEATREKYQNTNLWLPWMEKVRLWQVTSMDELDHFLQVNEDAPIFSWDIETSSLDNVHQNVCGHCIAFDTGEAVYVPTQHVKFPEQNLPHDQVWERVVNAMENRPVAVFNWMFEGRTLRSYGVNKPCHPDTVLDVFLYRILYDSDRFEFNLKAAAETIIGLSMLDIHQVPGVTGSKKSDISFHHSNPEDATLYAAADPLFTLAILRKIRHEVEAEQKFIVEMEHAVLDELLEMSENPIYIDRAYLRLARRELVHWIYLAEKRVFEEAGEEFNIGSPKQVGDVLTRMGVQLGKTGKGDPATGEKELEKVDKNQYPIVDHLLYYRKLKKELNSYVDALLGCTTEEDPTAVFRFKSIGAPTGRFASGKASEGDPVYAPMNVQAIPSASTYRKTHAWLVNNPPAELGPLMGNDFE